MNTKALWAKRIICNRSTLRNWHWPPCRGKYIYIYSPSKGHELVERCLTLVTSHVRPSLCLHPAEATVVEALNILCSNLFTQQRGLSRHLPPHGRGGIGAFADTGQVCECFSLYSQVQLLVAQTCPNPRLLRKALDAGL